MLSFIKKGSKKYFLVFLLMTFILLIFVWVFGRTKEEREEAVNFEENQVKESPLVVLSNEQKAKIPPVSKDDHIKGNKNALVTILVYTDFNCPYCGQYHTVLSKVLNEYKDEVRLIYRHYPIENTHPTSPLLAEASECANELGGANAFWRFVEGVFEEKDKFKDLEYAANSLSVNGKDLEDCLRSRRYKQKVDASYEGGLKAGIRVTPSTFIMNNKDEVWFIPGAYFYEDLKVLIEGMLS